MGTLILASGSPYRRLLLDRLGLSFQCVPADLDERPRPDETPSALVRRLAHAKAAAVARPGNLVIGSDQTAVLGSALLGKPGDRTRASAQLRALSGQSVVFLTAVALLEGPGGRCQEHLDKTTVTFRDLTDTEIRGYLQREQPYDCAGGFKAEGLGIALLERIESQDPTALIGLPLIWVTGALIKAGLNPLQNSPLA